MTTQSATESARAFAALSESEQDQRSFEAAKKIYRNPGIKSGFMFATITEFTSTLFAIGRFEEYETFSNPKKYDLVDSFYMGFEMETFFLINDLKPGIEILSFSFDKYERPEEFESKYTAKFEPIFQDLGSDIFRNSLFRYFAKYGEETVWSEEYEEWESLPNSSDPYITQSALTLKGIYGEEKVVNILDKIIADNSVSALDFIRLVTSKNDYTDYPLSWAMQVIE